MSISIDQSTAFVAVAETGSIKHAAKKLGKASSTVSNLRGSHYGPGHQVDDPSLRPIRRSLGYSLARHDNNIDLPVNEFLPLQPVSH